MSFIITSFSGCGFKAPIKLPLPDGVSNISVTAIHYNSAKFNQKQMLDFIKKYPEMTCLSNEHFNIMGKELINRKTKIDILRDIIIQNNNEATKGWF